MNKHVGAISVLTLLLAACGGESASDTDDESLQSPVARTTQVDASASDRYVYFNLTTGEQLALTDEQAASSGEWHVGFRRFAVKLNGGTSGPGAVAAALVNPQDDFYDDSDEPIASIFTNATPQSELTVLLDDYAEPGNWIFDAITSSFADGWYNYNPMSGVISANPDNGWLLRSAGGDSYARLRATEITFATRAGTGVESFTFEFDVQVQGTSQFTTTATFAGSIPPAGGEQCFDFDTDTTASCAGSDWDIKIGFAGRSFYLRSNSGVSGDGDGGVFGPFDWSELSAWQSATLDDSGTDITNRYLVDSSSGIFDESSWYAYNLTGMHRLWPNYRVYLVDTDRNDDSASRYLVQITGYYDATGASGHPRIRWRELSSAN